MDHITIGIPAGQLWGKLKRDDLGRLGSWHPLEAHCADVAAVFEALLSCGRLRSRLEAAAGSALDGAQVQRLAVLAALHDLGKCNTGFQRRADSAARNICGHVKPLAGLLARQHMSRTKGLLRGFSSWFDTPQGLQLFLQAAFSHHGAPSSPLEAPLNVSMAEAPYWNEEGNLSPFLGAEALISKCRDWFPEAFDLAGGSLPASTQFTHLFAGLVSLADWLGSDTRWFPFCGERDRPGPEHDSMPFARKAAIRALEEMGLHQPPATRGDGHPPAFRQQFGLDRPRPLQQMVMELPLDSGGDLVIVEGETGSGKTEAAWLHFMRLFCAGLVDGLYFANPLRLAATQIHQRLTAYAANSFGALSPPVVLAVPGYLRVGDHEGLRLPEYKVLWPDLDEPELATRFWAAESPKRFLCAPVAAGTVDQALMAGLRLAHAPLRSAALCRSLLVVDEVHASDAYMNGLLLNLLDLFRSCGGQVMLMSATLGAEAREAFLARWRAGAGRNHAIPAHQEAAAAPYPLVSRPGHIHPVPVAEPGGQKRVTVELHPQMTDQAGAATLAAQLARQGAVVLILRNTVRRAVETFLALEVLMTDQPELLFSAEGVATLHHGRFAAEDRRLLDRRLISLYGKKSGPFRHRQPGVVVATQTLEQSLDVDFDVLISDLCPMDVLLQRIGRLHRHGQTIRRPAFHEAVCHLLVPGEGEDWLRGGEAHGYGFGVSGQGDPMAYADPLSLVAAWRMLADLQERREPVRIPAMNRELVEGGLHSQVLEDLAKDLGTDWQADRNRLEGITGHRRQLAHGHGIDWSQPYGPDSAGVMDDHNIGTRLGLGDLQVELPAGSLGPFGHPVNLIRVPSWMAGKVKDAQLEDLQPLPGGGFGFRMGSRQFIYDRLGLQRGEEK